MKKTARLRASPIMSKYQRQQQTNKNVANDPIVRTTGRIKKPKAVFDPSDNYLPRSQRLPVALTTFSSVGCTNRTSQDRRNSLNQTPSATYDKSLASKDLCVVCGKHGSRRTSINLKNPLLSCLECESKIHRNCLKYDFDDFEKLRQTYKCENCALCDICLKNNNAGEGNTQVVTCAKCLKAFHIQCLETHPTGSPKQNWKCPNCDLDMETTDDDDLPVKKIREIIGDHGLTDSPPIKMESEDALPALKPYATLDISSAKGSDVSEIQEEDCNLLDEAVPDKMPNTEDSNIAKTNKDNISLPKVNDITDDPLDDIPDVKNWSVYEVYEYLRIYFPNEADVFKDQEIDGRSLLLLRRSDVVNNLPLKLGPSLRIYSFILKLQGRKNDPTLGWNCSA